MDGAFGRVPIYDEAWGEQFLTTLHQYVEALESSVDGDLEDEIETLSGVPFCGCSDCYDREAYLMAVKLTIEGYEEGRVRLA
jgi:hypothetical protein